MVSQWCLAVWSYMYSCLPGFVPNYLFSFYMPNTNLHYLCVKFDCVCLSLWVSHVMDWRLLHGVFLPLLFFSCLERLLPRFQIFSAKTQLINSLSYICMIVRLKKKKNFVYCMIDRKAAWIYSRCQATQRATPWSKSLINDFIVLSLFPSAKKLLTRQCGSKCKRHTDRKLSCSLSLAEWNEQEMMCLKMFAFFLSPFELWHY